MSAYNVKKDTMKRIVSDVSDIIKNPLTDNNIYYKHDENNMLKGYAMIIGSQNTCYYNGFYFFEFNFSNDYPFKPPKVIYNTNDGITRFNPNLYRDGKVCLSILNTWRGESWSSCQTIRSVLLILQSILNDEPLLNEPGINKTHSDFNKYNNVITYKNYEYALYKQYISDNAIFEIFRSDMKKYFSENKKNIINELNKISKINNSTNIYIEIYSFAIKINYPKLIEDIQNIIFD